MLAGRDYVQIREAARILGVSEQTLRNWDRRGKLQPIRHPINGYRMYRVAQIRQLLDLEPPVQSSLDFDVAEALSPLSIEEKELPPLHWKLEVALDPKHRPQHWDMTSSTVRRDWRKFPQEAHVIDATGRKYRRLNVAEIALLQGFDPSVVDVSDLTERQRIGALGDAVPPPLSRALFSAISEVWTWSNRTAVEICAGIGGLAEGAASADLEHLLLVDSSPVSGTLLRHQRPWAASNVMVGDARELPHRTLQGRVGLLSGGPPCQPWSQSGARKGEQDARDLMGQVHKTVAQLQPEVFAFENVPGLASGQNEAYLSQLIRRLREPGDGLRYGVLAAKFNAADFGVPQSRERIFIVGFRDSPASKVWKCFDVMSKHRTHQRPGSRGETRRPNWRTVGEALATLPDSGGWRRWVGY